MAREAFLAWYRTMKKAIRTRIGDSAAGKWITGVTRRADAVGHVKIRLAVCIRTAQSDARIYALVARPAYSRGRTVIVDCSKNNKNIYKTLVTILLTAIFVNRSCDSL